MISSHSRGSALQKNRLSSAKRRWDTGGLARETRIPVIFSWFSAWFRMLTSAYVHKMNMKGDKGSPCRKPRCGVMFPLGWPLNKTWYFTDDTHYPFNPCFWEPHLLHDRTDKFPLQPIINLAHVSLYRHPLISSSRVRAQSMKYFLSYQNIICYLSSSNKGWLGLRYSIW